ncbi:hypothetical protein [Streptomyces sp. TLI_171]|nr:hypothetical protein [Streptomyces sp. TLI_171]
MRRFKVVGRTSTTADAACDDFADVDAGRTSYTLCLARLGR